MCNCIYTTELIIGIIILVFAFWPGSVGSYWAGWIVVLAAVALILHAVLCKNIKNRDMGGARSYKNSRQFVAKKAVRSSKKRRR